MDKLRLDLVYAWRSLSTRRAATAAIIFVLALGIGLTAAMFALADPFFLRPLPYSRPQELVVIQLSAQRDAVQGHAPTLSAWQSRDDLFRGVAAYRSGDVLRLRVPAGGIALQSMEVSDNLFSVLGVAGSHAHNAPSIALSAELPLVITAAARARLGGVESEVNQAFARQDGGTVRIVDVLPADVLFPRARITPRLDAFVFVRDPVLIEIKASPGGQSFSANPFVVVARLRKGVTARGAEAALTAAVDKSRLKISVEPLTSYMRRGIEPLAAGAVAAGMLVLLICGGNIGNLLLARGVYRVNEFATRLAVGARGIDLVRLMLAELTLVAVTGIGSGLVLADVALGLAAAVIPAEYAALGMPAVTPRVVVFALLAGTPVIGAAAVPSWTVWRFGRGWLVVQSGTSDGRAVRVVRFVLAAGQSALAVVLLSAAALMVRSYMNLASQETGFARGAHVVSVSYPNGRIGVALQADIESTLRRFRHLHGVAIAGAAIGPMVDDLRAAQLVRVKNQTDLVERKYISVDYFDAVGALVVSGRGLAVDERRGAAVINESLARRYWPDGGAVGDQILLGAQPATIVGVARDTFDIALDMPPRPTVFTLIDSPILPLRVNYALRFAAGSPPVEAVLAREVAAVNADAVVIEMSSLTSRLSGTVRDRSFATLVLTFFAVAGTGVCAAGLIGIVSFVVARRTREIAVRMAVGAARSRIWWLVVEEALTAAGLGAAAGFFGGRWLSATLENHLYGVRAGDWPTMLIVALLMILTVVLSAVFPAHRAVQMSPSAALREQ